jgi:N-acetylmuramoyl-L-alanine amidase
LTRRQQIGAAAAVALVGGVMAVALASPGIDLVAIDRGWESAHRSSRSAVEWPRSAEALRRLDASIPPDFGKRRVYLDAGHGAPDNTGNRSAFCRDEQDFTLEAAERLRDHLTATGHFDVLVSRRSGEVSGYRARVAAAEAWQADAFISIHSDVRGRVEEWEPTPGSTCRRSFDAPGFSVLWSDDASAELGASRLGLARALALRLGESGFSAYQGDYQGLYDADEGDGATGGVFVDRHPDDERIFVLWRPTVPSVIIETHNAVDPDEASRWEEDRTFEVFGAAVIAALVDALR